MANIVSRLLENSREYTTEKRSSSASRDSAAIDTRVRSAFQKLPKERPVSKTTGNSFRVLSNKDRGMAVLNVVNLIATLALIKYWIKK